MEKVAGMMKGLKLSEEEKKGVKIRILAKDKGKSVEMQAVGKILLEKLVHPDLVQGLRPPSGHDERGFS